MPVEPPIEFDPEDIIRYLIYQQFYYGGDRIYGRTKDRSEEIEGAGNAIEEFYSIITERENLIDDGNHFEYLKWFNKTIHPIPIDDIMEKYLDYRDTLDDGFIRELIMTVIVGESLTEIQRVSFETSIANMTDNIMKERSLKSERRGELEDKITVLYGSGSPEIGMIYGLSFMKFIGNTVKNDNIVRECGELLEKYFKLISDRID